MKTPIRPRPLFLGLLLASVFGLSSGCESKSPTRAECTKNADCEDDGLCIDESCVARCDSHFDCRSSGLCEGASPPRCSSGDPAAAGQFYQYCPGGDTECDESAGFFCSGAGVGDIDAYCTTDCKADADCPSGHRCNIQDVTPCADACGLRGRKVPGCVPATEIGPGKPYQCGEPAGLVRHVCELRDFCDPCESDADCRGRPGQICARDKSGEKICTQTCDPSVDSCPWGSASECGLFDADRPGQYTCAHRFGACHGTGKGCEPCRDGRDCAPNGLCQRLPFTGEQYCVDLSVDCDCGDDAADGVCEGHGCPESPGGLAMTCNSGYCVGASSTTNPLSPSARSGCWPLR